MHSLACDRQVIDYCTYKLQQCALLCGLSATSLILWHSTVLYGFTI